MQAIVAVFEAVGIGIQISRFPSESFNRPLFLLIHVATALVMVALAFCLLKWDVYIAEKVIEDGPLPSIFSLTRFESSMMFSFASRIIGLIVFAQALPRLFRLLPTLAVSQEFTNRGLGMFMGLFGFSPTLAIAAGVSLVAGIYLFSCPQHLTKLVFRGGEITET